MDSFRSYEKINNSGREGNYLSIHQTRALTPFSSKTKNKETYIILRWFYRFYNSFLRLYLSL